VRIALFLTYGYGLSDWEEAGILDRELSLYRDHFDQGIRTLIVSYGSKNDLNLIETRPYLDLVVNRYNLPNCLYARLLPYLISRKGTDIDLIKTNQMYGAHVALRCSKYLARPFFIRQGHSFFESQTGSHPEKKDVVTKARRYEAYHIEQADLVTFPTEEMRSRALNRHQITLKNSKILPNYFLPDAWSPGYDISLTTGSEEVVFFGKFTRQKNIHTLIRAVAGEGLKLILIGDGPERSSLQKLAKTKGVDAEFPGRLPQASIRNYLSRALFFVLPSNYEGQPKALIEAMAFGIPVLVTDSVGVKSEVIHGRTGLVVENTIEGLRKGIKQYHQMKPSDRNRLANNARKRVFRKYSLSAVAATERVQFQEIVSVR